MHMQYWSYSSYKTNMMGTSLHKSWKSKLCQNSYSVIYLTDTAHVNIVILHTMYVF